MKKVKLERHNLPAYWASALVNDDFSGLSDEDESLLRNWVEKNPCLNCTEVSEETFYGHFNGLGDNLAEFTFIVN